MKTLYGDVDNLVFEQAKSIKLFVCDIDGVFSDGRIYLGNDRFHIKDLFLEDGRF